MPENLPAKNRIEVEPSAIGPRAGENLIEEMRPLVDRHGVGTEALAGAVEEALREVDAGGPDKAISGEELRSSLLGLVLWKIFGKGAALWINPKTGAGQDVPLEVLVDAFSMWGKAANLAARHGVDVAAAAEAYSEATHATADRLAAGAGSEGKEIRDVRKYLFASYMHRLSDIGGRQGSSRTDLVDMEGWVANRELTDKGAFLEVLNSGIYCREFLDAMPPKGRSVAIARYILGYSWPETAGALSSSVNAVQKALSVGVRKAVGMCMRELRRSGIRRPVDIEVRKTRSRKTPH